MRLELYLDIAMERLIYGWGAADVPEQSDDDSSDEEEEDAMKEEPDMMLEDVQISIAVENIWGNNQLEDDEMLHDNAESFVVTADSPLEDIN